MKPLVKLSPNQVIVLQHLPSSRRSWVKLSIYEGLDFCIIAETLDFVSLRAVRGLEKRCLIEIQPPRANSSYHRVRLTPQGQKVQPAVLLARELEN